MKKIYYPLVSSIIITLLLAYFNVAVAYRIIHILLFVLSLSIFLKEVLVLWKYFVNHMFNIKSPDFDKRVQRPRLFFYLIFGLLSLFFLYQFAHINLSSALNRYLLGTIYLLTYTGFTFLLFYSWTKGFQIDLIPKLQKNILESQDREFELKWGDKHELIEIYNRMIEKSFISMLNSDESTEKASSTFAQIILDGNTPAKQVFKVHFDNIQTYHFFKHLEKDSNNFNLNKFFRIFENNNGIPSRNSVTTSVKNAKSGAKRQDDIDWIFKT